MKAALSLTAAAALTAVLAACGSSTGTATQSTTPAAPAAASTAASESAMASQSAMASESAMASGPAMASHEAMASGDAAAMAADHKQKFCAAATDLGSLTKGTADAMAMSPAESVKDFQALGAKVAALKANAATPALMTDIDTVVSKLTLEAMVESHKADGTSATDAMTKLDSAKAGADAAASRIIGAVKETCGVDIT